MERERVFLTIEQAAQLLGYTTGTLRKKCMMKQIPYYKPSGKNLYFEKTELYDWIASHRVATSAEVMNMATNL